MNSNHQIQVLNCLKQGKTILQVEAINHFNSNEHGVIRRQAGLSNDGVLIDSNNHLKAEFYNTKDLIQSHHKVHNSYFEQLDEFFGIYEYLAGDRLKEKEQVAVMYQNEWDNLKDEQA